MFAAFRTTRQSVLPGFGLTFGYTLFYLGVIVLLPLSALFGRAAGLSWTQFVNAIFEPRVLAALRLSYSAALIGALINLVFGFIIAWVIVRYRFPGRRIVDALIDLPFALPTAVAGLALTTIYAGNGWIGGLLAPLGIKVAFAPLGVVVAVTFVGLPFVVRTLQPVLQDLDAELEEAAASLGASPFQVFVRVLWPELRAAALTGFALALARGLGEYGSIVFISGNLPLKTEIAPLLIVSKLEQYDYGGATAIAVTMLSASLGLLLLINLLQRYLSAANNGTDELRIGIETR